MDNYRILAREWFDAAESDYRYTLVGAKEEIVYPQVAFSAQQVAEKFLKGLLVLHGIEPPRIHNLPRLLGKCAEIVPELETIRDDCESLTGYYIDTRYPPSIPDYPKEEILQALSSAEKIREAVQKAAGLE